MLSRKFTISLTFLLSLFVGSFCFAQTLDKTTEVQKIQALNGKILEEDLYTPTYYDVKTNKVIVGDLQERYTYIGEVVKDASNIVFDDNSIYSAKEKIDDKTYKIYPQPIYIRDTDNFVKELITATTSASVWDEANIETLQDKIISLFKTPYVIAETYYSNPSIGTARNTSASATFANVYNDNGGGTFTGDPTWCLTSVNSVGNSYEYIDRGFLVFNALGDTRAIASSTLALYTTGITATFSGTDYLRLTKGTLANTSAIANSDFQGTKANSTPYATDKDLTSLTTGHYEYFSLNADGRANISNSQAFVFGIRTQYDADNQSPNDLTANHSDYYEFSSSDHTGTGQDPYLLVEFSEDTGGETGTSTNQSAITCDNMNYNQKCTITGYSYINGNISTTTEITTYNFLNSIFLLFEIICAFLIIIGIIKYKRS